MDVATPATRRGHLEVEMCRRVTCDRCGKPTFAGCGMHVEQVLGDVPPEKRCTCHTQATQQPQRPTVPTSWRTSGR